MARSGADLRDEIDGDLAEVRVAISETTTREVDIEGVLAFAEELLLDPAKMWRQLPHEKRRLFQGALFPMGITYNGEVRTETTASFIAELRHLVGAKTEVASPTGVEPVSPP